MENLINGRCGWCKEDKDYIKYHDEEWGRLVKDDKALFEFLVLESAQAGLSWITVLKKRDGYRKAFHDFDVEKVAKMTDADVIRLKEDNGIIKNKLKIASTITNAQLFIAIQKEYGSFYNYVLSFFEDGQPIVNHFEHLKDVPATSAESDAISKEMKKRGFKFFGSTICYAYLQAVGFVDDHLVGCVNRK